MDTRLILQGDFLQQSHKKEVGSYFFDASPRVAKDSTRYEQNEIKWMKYQQLFE